MKSRKTIRIKAIAVPNPCIFRASCQGACEWCDTHSYSEACVGMLQHQCECLRKNWLAAESEKKQLQAEKANLYTLEDIAHKLCCHFCQNDECDESICPAFNLCHRGHNGILALLRKVVN